MINSTEFVETKSFFMQTFSERVLLRLFFLVFVTTQSVLEMTMLDAFVTLPLFFDDGIMVVESLGLFLLVVGMVSSSCRMLVEEPNEVDLGEEIDSHATCGVASSRSGGVVILSSVSELYSCLRLSKVDPVVQPTLSGDNGTAVGSFFTPIVSSFKPRFFLK